MRITAKNRREHGEKVAEALKALVEYGLPVPTSPFGGVRHGGRPDGIDPDNVLVPIPQSAFRGVWVDLSAVDPGKILHAMFAAAWSKGVEEGRRDAENRQAEALVEAFPRLRDTIRELAQEVADNAVAEARDRPRD